MIPAVRETFVAANARARLPYDAEVEWLESTGTQWIDTGFVPRNNLRFTLWFSGYSFAAQDGPAWFFGSRSAYQSNGCGSYYDGARIYAASGAQQSSTILSSSLLESAGVHTLSVITGSGLWLDGVQRIEFGASADVWGTPTNAVALLRIRLSATGLSVPPCKLRMRRFAVVESDDSAYLHDYVSVRFKNEHGISEGALYDRVAGRLFRNAGTGTFAFGTDVAGGGHEWLRCLYSRSSARSTRLWKEAA